MPQHPDDEEFDEEEFEEEESDDEESEDEADDEGSGEGFLIDPEDYYDLFMPDSFTPGGPGMPLYEREEAYRRVKHVCGRAQGLINSVPDYLPVEGEPDRGSQLEPGVRKSLLDTSIAQVNLEVLEWVALCRVLPKQAATALQTLARTVDGIWRRWSKAEERYRREEARECAARLRGQKPTRELVRPVRFITSGELTLLKQSLSVVQEAVAREEERTKPAAGARARRPGPGSRALAGEREEARGKWIYENVCDISRTLDQILIEYNKEADKHNWTLITSVNGLKDRAEAYAKRKHLPLPPPRR
jgi:hypothetical protein